MKNKFTLIMALATATLFVACGGSGDTNTASAPVTPLDPTGTAMSSEQLETTPSSTSQGSEDLVDYRDGNTYKTVTIGPMTWMAENLRYSTGTSACESEKIEYGCFYSWETAVSACPVGWHLSSKAEWETLFVIAGGGEVAAIALRSTNGWEQTVCVVPTNDGYFEQIVCAAGTDDYGFSALPSGNYYNIESYFRSTSGHERASYWTSTEYSSGRTYVASIDVDDVSLEPCTRDTSYTYERTVNTYHWGYPVRCVKN